MTVAASLTVSPSTPAHGAVVTATYGVTGNIGASGTVSGDVVVGTQTIAVSTTVTLPALPESFAMPTCPGLTFSATSTPGVFTAIVP